MNRILVLLAGAALLALPVASASAAVAPQPPLDRAALKATYNPVGFFKPGDPIPAADAPPPPGAGGVYNPSGHYSAYDTNVFESLNFPGRQAGDTTNNDPPGTNDPLGRYGYCAPDPMYMPQGRCLNHALEYLDYYEKTMTELLKDFGGTVKRYEFENPGRSDVGGAVGEPGGLSSPGGKTYNIAGIVPGADNPEEEVIVSGHWDFTDAAHAAAWDSSEGHAEVIRMAKIMTDYWRATGTRPSATIKFMPWAAEESGTYGSLDYVTNYVADETDALRIRGYFNVDPCAGAYPAFYHGNPAQRIRMVLHLVDPSGAQDPERVTAFNKKAEQVVDEFWADVDDTVEVVGGTQPIYTDADRTQIVTALGGLLVFGSDYLNFEAIGVPFMNLFPDMFGAHADGNPGDSSEGVATIHTPRDNVQTLNALTGPDQTGLNASDGWMKGMELCAQLESRYMLQPEMAGAQTANLDPVAFMEVFKPKALKGKLVTFDGGGSYQYTSLMTRSLAADADLQYKWDFGDSTPEAFGRTVKHAYRAAGTYKATLTVTNRNTHASDKVTRLVTVEDAEGTDADPAGQGSDPGLRAKGSVVACQSNTGFKSASVKPSGKGLAFSAQTTDGKAYGVSVFQAARGSKATKPKRVASFTVNGSTTWDGKGATKKGVYYVEIVNRGTGASPEVRSFAFERKGSKFKARKAFRKVISCDKVSLFSLATPVFGGSRKLGISFTLTEASKVTVQVFRGKARKAVKTFRKNVKAANRLQKLTLSPKKLRKGEYRIVLKAGKAKATLYARKL